MRIGPREWEIAVIVAAHPGLDASGIARRCTGKVKPDAVKVIVYNLNARFPERVITGSKSEGYRLHTKVLEAMRS